MTKRAKRLAKYLENDLGWSVFDPQTTCKKCSRTVFGDKYCPQCGTKQGKPTKSKNDVICEIEKAISYALEETA